MEIEIKEKSKPNGSIVDALAGFFTGYRKTEKPENLTVFEDAPIAGGFPDQYASVAASDDSSADVIRTRTKPKSRSERYAIIDEIRRHGIIQEGITTHISSALAPDSKSKQSFYLKSKDPADKVLVDWLNETLIPVILRGIVSWSKVASEYGVAYPRPIYKEGVGIVDFEFNYYTMPHHIRMYERGGKVAAFTNQHMRTNEKGGVEIIPPWGLIPLRIPYGTPDIDDRPDAKVTALYSLLNEEHREIAIESQDYGESFIINCYEPLMDLIDALLSLRASRTNASKRERLIKTYLGKLGSKQASQWLSELYDAVKSDDDWNAKRHASAGTRSTIENKFLPMRDGTNVETEMLEVDPNIQHIVDIEFYTKQIASYMGLDYTQLGFADQMSGGLGEGGFTQVSLQSGRRPALLRMAIENFINDACVLHIFYAKRKAVPKTASYPWEIIFTSMNETIKTAEEEEARMRADRAAILAGVIDAIVQGGTSRSKTLTRTILGDALNITEDALDAIMEELFAQPEEESDEEEMDEESGSEALMAALKDNPEATSLLLAQLLKEDH